MNTELRLRETIQWNPDADGVVVRYDFAYRDPASGWAIQIGMDVCTLYGEQAELDKQVVPVARANITRMLKRKCGVKRAIENQLPLNLPCIVRGRYV